MPDGRRSIKAYPLGPIDPAASAMSDLMPDGTASYDVQARAEFHKSSTHILPPGYTPWRIRVDYPKVPPSNSTDDAPWLKIDFVSESERYLMAVRDYCFQGMIKADFFPQHNKDRDWYHAPWMHYGKSGREPLRGLTSERYVPPRELSATQQRTTQTWGVGFFNSAGASVFGKMWDDPANPAWKEDMAFPEGTAIFKLLYTNATDAELPNMQGAPSVEAMIAVQPDDPTVKPSPRVRLTDRPEPVRILQMDIAVRDPRAQPSQWVWGTYMYNFEYGEGYYGLMPVGLSWGLDPQVDQKAIEAGQKLQEVWINPEADKLRVSLHGGRPSFGWNGRLNGPADDFISACQSCHSMAQWVPDKNAQGVSMVPPYPVQDGYGNVVPVNDSITMSWFRNIPWRTPATKEGISADNSLQLLIGYENFVSWRAKYNNDPSLHTYSPRDPGYYTVFVHNLRSKLEQSIAHFWQVAGSVLITLFTFGLF